MRVETWKYEYAWGKQPKGYGAWWFEILIPGCETEIFQFTSTYANAKAAAIKYAKERKSTERKSTEIFVCS